MELDRYTVFVCAHPRAISKWRMRITYVLRGSHTWLRGWFLYERLLIGMAAMLPRLEIYSR